MEILLKILCFHTLNKLNICNYILLFMNPLKKYKKVDKRNLIQQRFNVLHFKFKVFENGFYGEGQQFFFNTADALKGTGSDVSGRERQLQRLLDDLSTNRVFSNPVNPKLTSVARTIFDKYGNEIKDILKLEYDQEIWVAFGEPFISPFCEYNKNYL